MKILLIALAAALALAGCSSARSESPSQPEAFAPQAQTSEPLSPSAPSSLSTQPEGAVSEFDLSVPQDRYLFFTADDPGSIFEIASGDVFAGWTADAISFAGEAAGPDPVNLRASFTGSVPLSGELVLFEDRLGGSIGLIFYPDEESAAIPRFYGEDPESLYTITLEGIAPEELENAFGEPLIRKRDLGDGEAFTESYYPGCSILGTELFIQIGSDSDGRPAVGYVYTLIAALVQEG